MAVTQKEIAKRLNISRSWVARALNGYESVPPEMRARVQAMAEEMGYDLNTNQAARSLIAQRYGIRVKTGVIAVVFPPMVSASPYHMPFYTPFLNGMRDEAAAVDMDLVTFEMRPGELPRIIRDRSVDGMVSIGFLEHEIADVRALGIPVITYQACFGNAHSMMVDDVEGTRLATRHLLEIGHREIAFLGVRRDWDIGLADELRQKGYELALAEYGVPVREELIDISLPIPDTSSHKYCVGCGRCAACVGWQALKAKSKWKSRPKFTAVVCHHDPIAMGIIEHARKEDGLKVPKDLSVVGFDDTSHLYHLKPHVTSISFSREEMGRDAVKIISNFSAIPEENEEYVHRIFPVKLEVHQSTAPPNPALHT